MRKNLEISLKLMFGSEGEYINRSTDRGGPTKYGITIKTLEAHRGHAVTTNDVKKLTLAEAETIYRQSYWSQSGGDLLPSGLDYAAFDFGVNSGPARAVKILQKLVGVTADGIVGAQTVNAVNHYDGGLQKLIRDYCNARMTFLRQIGGKTGWRSNGRGWTIRVTGIDPKGQWASEPGVVGNALAMVRHDTLQPSAGKEPAGKADPADKSLSSIVRDPKAWGPLGGLLAAAGGIFSGTGPVQYVLAAGVVVLIGIGLYYVVKRERESG